MLRVGTVPYLVGRPLDTGLADEAGIELSHRVPAGLVEGLRKGELDVALVSSIELFRRPGYTFLDGIAVAGRGAVSSVQVFLERPLEEVRTIALDPASRSAAALARAVWPGGERRRPLFVPIEPGEDLRAAGTDAWLQIGDAALKVSLGPDPPPAFNPSAAFAARTGLPFVFAAWVAAPGVSLAAWAPAFARARARGTLRIEELSREAARAWGVSERGTGRYLAEECLFEPGEAMRPALRAFRDLAAPHGLCRGNLDPSAVPLPVPHLAR
ncbi:MAG: MqnA/MqnD/SBP family protein [Planctomycetota bacterium]